MLERVGRAALFASLGLVLFKLSAAQVMFGVAALVWLYSTLTERDRPPLPVFFWPLLAYGALTVVSALFSADRTTSLIDLKQLVLYLIVPIVMRFAAGRHAMTSLNVIIALGAAAAVLGVVQGTALHDFGDLSNRPSGTIKHYMTYSGVIMLVLCAAAARLVFGQGSRIWPAVAVPALAVALAATLSRNAYIGAVVGVGCLLVARRAKLLIMIPVVVGLAFLVPQVRARALSTFDLSEDSNRDRVQMWGIGARIVRDHPLVGVGPNQVMQVYPKYRPADAVHPVNIHLHNVFIQIAAERGVPALVAWLTFIGVATAGLLRQMRSGPSRALGGAGVAAIAAMLAAGLFEHNFGDSEFLMLFLGMITLPYAARLPGPDGEPFDDGGPSLPPAPAGIASGGGGGAPLPTSVAVSLDASDRSGARE
jgi:putative inorganic carbon (hco3(-)) transporter